MTRVRARSKLRGKTLLSQFTSAWRLTSWASQLKPLQTSAILMAESTCINNSDHVVSVPTAIKAADGFFTQIPQSEESSVTLFRQFKLTPPSWSEFQKRFHAMTQDGSRNLKLVLFIRHGEGLHNEAIKKYGSERWCKELVFTDVYRDAELTPFGIQEAKSKGPPLIKAGLERGMPRIERVIVSPISRAIQTAQHFFGEDQVPDAPFVCMENCREHLGVDTCNNRRSLSELKLKFPDVDFSAIKDEEDVLWTTERRESDEEIQTRAKEFLLDLFRTIPEQHVAVVTHFGFIQAVCAATLGVEVEASKCEVVPLVLEAL